MQRWRDAFATTGIDPDFYAHRQRSFAERLPWDHIGVRLPRAYLERSCDDYYAQLGLANPARATS